MPTTAPTAQMTDVLGYFNPNKFPVSINSDQDGLQIIVPRGGYVEDRNKQKINDPRLDFYAKAGGLLVKEYTEAPVPLILLRGQPPLQNISAETSVRSGGIRTTLPLTAIMKRGDGPELPTAKQLMARGQRPDSGNASVHGMSLEDAIKAGYIDKSDRNRPDPMDRAPAEDTTGEAARKAPTLPLPGRALLPPRLAPQMQTLQNESVDPTKDDIVDEVFKQAKTPEVVALPQLPPAKNEPDVPEGASITTVVPGAKAKPKTEKLRGPKVEFDGKKFTTVKALRSHLTQKFQDQALVDEAIEPFLA